MRVLKLILILAAGVVLVSAPVLSPAKAQTECLEGRTAGGTCVDASLGSLARERVRIFTQPRLSYSGAAVAPNADRRYDALRDWGQGHTREIYGPCLANYCP